MGAKCGNHQPDDLWSKFPECVPTGEPQERERRNLRKSRDSGTFRSRKHLFDTDLVWEYVLDRLCSLILGSAVH